MNFAGTGFDLTAHQARVAALAPARLPGRGHLPAHLRWPIELLRNTWTAAAALIDVYQGRARAYVLDDGPDEQARSMAGCLRRSCRQSVGRP